MDFLAHPFWDKYNEFEERMEQPDRIFAILTRVISIPMHQYARYFEKYRNMAQSRPLTAIAPTGILTKYQMELEAEGGGYKAGRSQMEVETDLRMKIDGYHMSLFQSTQVETTKRWPYESEIKRPYFHVTDLDEPQLVNWRKYLDFEEAEGDYTRIQFLYERCLVTCAHHDEFWFRYARWMSAQPNKHDDVRNIYQRAACVFVPVAVPTIRLYYAYFEEMQGRVDVAKAIHEAILFQLPSHIETIISWANTCRRHGSLESAIEIYQTQLENPLVDQHAKAAVIAEWAKLLVRVNGAVEQARQIFKKNQSNFLDSSTFWTNFLEFETNLQTTPNTAKSQLKSVKSVADDILHKSRLTMATIQELVTKYMEYLMGRGGKDAANEFLSLDREINGLAAIQKFAKMQQSHVGHGKERPNIVNGQMKRGR